ncbi:MAG: hypothetical protein FGM58_10800 [Acidimicrobiia bacterium]|nr:hypothetical protein [Acidimicrobiia bacterium]
MTRRRVLLAITAIFVIGVVGAGVWLWIAEETTSPRSATALCERLAETSGLDDAIVTVDPTRLGPLVSALERATQSAPPEIAEQLDILTTFVVEVADEVRAEPTDKRGALTEALAARQDRIDTVSAAGAAVEQWNGANCGTSLRSTTTRR